MRPRPLLFTAAAGLLALGSAFSWWGFTATARAEIVRSRAEQALAQTRQRAEQLEAAVKVAGRPPAEVATLPLPAMPANGLTPVASRPGSDAATATAEAALRSPSTPSTEAERRQEKLAEYRAHLDERWGLLIATMKLTPLQTERLKDLLTWRQSTELSLEAKAKAEGLTEESPQIQALDDEYGRAFKTELRTLLDREAYAKYRDYYPARHVAPLLTNVAATLANADVPLDNATALALLYVLADASQKKPSGTALPDTIDWDKALVVAKPLLSPAQHTLLSTLATRQTTEQLVDNQVRRLLRRSK